MAASVVVTYAAQKGGKKREEIGIAGVFVPFARALLATGRSVMRAEVEAGSLVHQACLANPVFTVLSREAGADLTVALPVTVSIAPRDDGDPPIVVSARRNGWGYPDMTGAGENNIWDERGGRGERSGLSMAELALCVPPPGWLPTAGQGDVAPVPGLCDTHWPWEVPGFVAPGLGWRPPALKLKRRLADDAPPADEAPASTVSPLDETPAEPEPAPAPEPFAEDAPERATRRAKPPETRTDEVLADVSEERRGAAVAKLLALWSAGNQAPSINKAQHALKKAGFEFTKAQVEALLNVAGAQARAVTAPPS